MKMIVIYRTPVNTAAFDEHYFKIHIPLAKKLPGLRKYEVSTGSIVPLIGDKKPYLIGILHFDDMAAFRIAFESDAGKACAEDRKILAPDNDDVQIFLFDNKEV